MSTRDKTLSTRERQEDERIRKRERDKEREGQRERGTKRERDKERARGSNQLVMSSPNWARAQKMR
jgi:hypothetical protein